MSISSLASQPGAGVKTPLQSETDRSYLVQDYDKFVKLLVAQVQNQDPLSPMDGTQFISQLAQLSQVEQAVKTNASLESLNATLGISSALNQTAMIGREVTALSETFVLGAVGGKFSYEFSQSPTAVSAVITDMGGNVVRQIDGLSTESGKVIDVMWDGTDSAGNFAPQGEYRVTLATPDGAGGYNTYSTSTVESIEFAGGQAIMRLADGRTTLSTDIVRAR